MEQTTDYVFLKNNKYRTGVTIKHLNDAAYQLSQIDDFLLNLELRAAYFSIVAATNKLQEYKETKDYDAL